MLKQESSYFLRKHLLYKHAYVYFPYYLVLFKATIIQVRVKRLIKRAKLYKCLVLCLVTIGAGKVVI